LRCHTDEGSARITRVVDRWQRIDPLLTQEHCNRVPVIEEVFSSLCEQDGDSRFRCLCRILPQVSRDQVGKFVYRTPVRVILVWSWHGETERPRCIIWKLFLPEPYGLQCLQCIVPCLTRHW